MVEARAVAVCAGELQDMRAIADVPHGGVAQRQVSAAGAHVGDAHDG
jgi:hypothetical protein